jgi:hypothetical protein
MIIFSREPLAVLAEVVFEEQESKVLADFFSHLCFNWVNITICLLERVHIEIGLDAPTCRCGAVGHTQQTVLWFCSACQNINPHGDDACNMFEKVVAGSIQQILWEVETPGPSFMAISSESMRARVRSVDFVR